MSAVTIFLERLQTEKDQIVRPQAKIESAKAAKEQALSNGDDAGAIRLNRKLKELQEGLEDVEITNLVKLSIGVVNGRNSAPFYDLERAQAH